ncbi:hypothetical protein D9M71_675260 [compost metagenome]
MLGIGTTVAGAHRVALISGLLRAAILIITLLPAVRAWCVNRLEDSWPFRSGPVKPVAQDMQSGPLSVTGAYTTPSTGSAFRSSPTDIAEP